MISIKNKYAFILITIILLIFNLDAIFIEVLYQDDNSIYYDCMLNSFDSIKANLNRNIIFPYMQYVLGEVLTFSPFLARFTILLLAILCSYLMFNFYSSCLEINQPLSLITSILPFIIPQQTLIPTFVMGSYQVWTVLILLAIFLNVFNLFSQKETINNFDKNIFQLILIILIITSTIMFNNPLLTLPFILVIFHRFKFNKITMPILFAGIFSVLYKVISILNSNNKIQSIRFESLSELLSRFSKSIAYSNPFNLTSELHIGILLIVLLILSLISVILLLIKNGVSVFKNFKLTAPIIFSVSWIVASLSPYFFSPYFSSRYLFTFGIGINLLLFQLINFWFKHFFRKKELLIWISGILVIMISGYNRIKEINGHYKYREEIHRSLKSGISDINFPFNSQIVAIGKAQYLYTNGFWKWSSGYFKYLTGRDDITGTTGFNEKLLYDPVGSDKRNYSNRLSGLDINAPIFIFSVELKSTTRLYYLLRVYPVSNDSKTYVVYELDKKTGLAQEMFITESIVELDEFLSGKSITPNDIFGY